jgi:hypothetical protein
MLYRGPGFLAAVYFGSTPTPPPRLSRQKDRPATHRKTEKERQVGDGRWEGDGRGAESYDRKKALSMVFYKPLNTLWVPHNCQEEEVDLGVVGVFGCRSVEEGQNVAG